MLKAMESLRSFQIVATDGQIGKATDLLFDDAEWTVRHIVVDMGGLFTGKSVLISPHAVAAIDPNSERIEVNLTRQEIQDAPSIDTDLPVSRQFETDFYDYYHLPYYWTGPYVWGPWLRPVGASIPPASKERQEELAAVRERFNPNLRSFKKVNGYRIEATDGAMGDIEDVLFDDEDWSVRYLVVDTSKFLPSKDVYVPRDAVREVDWEYSTVRLNLTKEQLKNMPSEAPAA